MKFWDLIFPDDWPPSAGIGFLVQLRGDLLAVIKQDPAFSAPLRALSEHIRQALAGWFSPGLMQLRRITWEKSSGDMLERIMKVTTTNINLLVDLGRHQTGLYGTYTTTPGIHSG